MMVFQYAIISIFFLMVIKLLSNNVVSLNFFIIKMKAFTCYTNINKLLILINEMSG